MARFLIRQAHGGESRTVSDGALAFFLSQGYIVIDTLDDDSDSPPLYITADESDLRYAQVGDIGDDTSPTGSELRTFFEAKVDRTGASEGDVPALQADGTLAFEAGGGGGAVASVNGQTGTVVLDADDIDDGTSYVVMTTAERAALTALANAPYVVRHSGGTDPDRPATTRPVIWVVPDGNRPATSGTTAGGDYAAVDGLDFLWTY